MKFAPKFRLSSTVAAGIAAAGLGVMLTAAPASAATAHPLSPGCGWAPANNYGKAGYFYTGGTNIRSGPSTLCYPPRAQSSADDSVSLRCWAPGDDGYDWFYLTDDNSNKGFVLGWARDDVVGVLGSWPGRC